LSRNRFFLGRRRLLELKAPDRLDARGHCLRRKRLRVGAGAAHYELNEKDDPDHRHQERKQDHDDQLLGGLDKRLVLVVRHCESLMVL
jgi:hypothetical protein